MNITQQLEIRFTGLDFLAIFLLLLLQLRDVVFDLLVGFLFFSLAGNWINVMLLEMMLLFV
jgi:hypothetical protein